MAKNDKVLVDGLIDDRIELNLPSKKRDEAFEFLVFEQLLKDFDLSIDDLKSGIVDGRNDGGIDGMFIFINGHLLSEIQSFSWPKTGSVLEVWIITCKHHDTFKQAPLDNLVASSNELLDFTIEQKDLKGDYSEAVIKRIKNLRYAYRKVSPRLTKFNINFCYASRGNTEQLGESISSRAEQLKQTAIDFFGDCHADFIFLGSSELIELNRKAPNFSFELPFVEALSSGMSYVLLVKLKDYFNFVTDNGKLKRYLFDSNVRDFAGLNRVNEDIRDTLTSTNSPDFWWLNNGVTILSTKALIIGKDIHIEDIQIVNGLQSTESIFRHFQNGGEDPEERSILVKVIESNDASVRDSIIRATNNQTNVELASLHATDKIQRDIEDILIRSGLYYERRTNFYKNQGISAEKILTPLYLASGFVSLILKAPHQASFLKSRFMRSETSYNNVFSNEIDLNVWPQIAHILKKTDTFLESVRPKRSGGIRFLKSRRQFIIFLTTSRIFGSFNFNVNHLINFDISKYDTHELAKTWDLFRTFNNNFRDLSRNHVEKKSFLIKLCEAAEKEWNIKGIERMNNLIPIKTKPKKDKTSAIPLTMEFALKVHELLPEQPWKPGIHREVMAKLNCTATDYFDAVEILINEGLRNHQKDGVVFDEEGNVISFDKDRVDSETMKLYD